MERELGAQLFARTPDGVRPTPVGATVVDGAREVLARYDQLLADVAGELDPESGVARLAFLDSMATSLVPRLLRDFHAAAPAVRVLLSQEPAHEMEADLARGAVDLAVTSHPRAGRRVARAAGGAHGRRGPADAPARGPARLTLDELDGEELVTTPSRLRVPLARRRPAARGGGDDAGLLREPGPRRPSRGWSRPAWGWRSCPRRWPGCRGRRASRSPGRPAPTGPSG